MDKIFPVKSKKEEVTVEDVFSTYVYSGNSSTNTISNGVNLQDNEGFVWVRNRVSLGDTFYTTIEGVGKYLTVSSSLVEADYAYGFVTSFNEDGFTLGESGGSTTHYNATGYDYVSYTFREAPKFMDMVKYTGSANTKQIPHRLGLPPGIVIIKNLEGNSGWHVYHKYSGIDKQLQLNLDSAETTYTPYFTATPDSSFITITGSADVNNLNDNYIAYVFADDTSEDGLIRCGSFTSNTSVVLGWEPQFILYKRTDSTGNWVVLDCIRGIVSGGNDTELYTNINGAEAISSSDYITLTPTGFDTTNLTGDYVYMAIRRSMIEPKSSDEVFAITNVSDYSPANRSGFVVDTAITLNIYGNNTQVRDRLRGKYGLFTSLSQSEADLGGVTSFDYMNGYEGTNGPGFVNVMLRRAKGFFDVVCYTGDGTNASDVHHNFGVPPEMVWVKSRDAVYDWAVYHKLSNTDVTFLNYNYASINSVTAWGSTDPTDTVFSKANYFPTNRLGTSYIAYLFATLPGISKVGYYEGNGVSQTIDCGFSTGSKFILIKRSNGTGDWYVYDSVRGIVTGNDPFLKLNTTNAQVTTDDSIDPHSSGFIVNQTSTTNLNVTNGMYIYYAIAN